MRTYKTCLMVALLCAAHGAGGEVLDSADSGFTVQSTASVAADPIASYRALVDEIAQWWNGAHSFSGDAGNLYIDTEIPGCFCERLPGGGGVRHMSVVHASPGQLLRMEGGLGPLQGLAITGAMSWEFKARNGGGTDIILTYRVVGHSDGGIGSWAAPVDRVLTEQLHRLQGFLEDGSPAGGQETSDS